MRAESIAFLVCLALLAIGIVSETRKLWKGR